MQYLSIKSRYLITTPITYLALIFIFTSVTFAGSSQSKATSSSSSSSPSTIDVYAKIMEAAVANMQMNSKEAKYWADRITNKTSNGTSNSTTAAPDFVAKATAFMKAGKKLKKLLNHFELPVLKGTLLRIDAQSPDTIAVKANIFADALQSLLNDHNPENYVSLKAKVNEKLEKLHTDYGHIRSSLPEMTVSGGTRDLYVKDITTENLHRFKSVQFFIKYGTSGYEYKAEFVREKIERLITLKKRKDTAEKAAMEILQHAEVLATTLTQYQYKVFEKIHAKLAHKLETKTANKGKKCSEKFTSSELFSLALQIATNVNPQNDDEADKIVDDFMKNYHNMRKNKDISLENAVKSAQVILSKAQTLAQPQPACEIVPSVPPAPLAAASSATVAIQPLLEATVPPSYKEATIDRKEAIAPYKDSKKEVVQIHPQHSVHIHPLRPIATSSSSSSSSTISSSEPPDTHKIAIAPSAPTLKEINVPKPPEVTKPKPSAPPAEMITAPAPSEKTAPPMEAVKNLKDEKKEDQQEEPSRSRSSKVSDDKVLVLE